MEKRRFMWGNPEKSISGAYFPYCQWCKFDGQCELKHHEYMGVPSQGKIDDSPYPGHEDLTHGFTIFQGGKQRSTCAGRIGKTDNLFYPLACECGTVISSLGFSAVFGGAMCQKFRPNAKGNMRQAIYTALLLSKGEDIRDQLTLLEFDDFDSIDKPDPNILDEEGMERLEELCPCDPDYRSVMRY